MQMNEQKGIIKARYLINQARYREVMFSEIPDEIFMIFWDIFEKQKTLTFNKDSTGFLRIE